MNRGSVDTIRFGPSFPPDWERDGDMKIEEIKRHAENILKERDRLMKPTRCKVRLTSISESYSNGRAVKFVPVTSGSDENKSFYAATPGGQFEMTLSDAAAKNLGLDTTGLGHEFYVDFTPAEKTG